MKLYRKREMNNTREYAIIMKTNVTEGDKRYQYQFM